MSRAVEMNQFIAIGREIRIKEVTVAATETTHFGLNKTLIPSFPSLLHGMLQL